MASSAKARFLVGGKLALPLAEQMKSTTRALHVDVKLMMTEEVQTANSSVSASTKAISFSDFEVTYVAST